MAEHWVGGKLQRDEALASKLIVMVGKKGGKSIAGRMIPGFAIAYNAVANRRDINRLGKRAVAFYCAAAPIRRRPQASEAANRAWRWRRALAARRAARRPPPWSPRAIAW